MIWAILTVGVAASFPGFGVQVSSDLINEGIQTLAPYVISALDGFQAPPIEEKTRIALMSLDMKLLNLTLYNVTIDLNQTYVAFVEPNAVQVNFQGVGLTAVFNYDIKYGLVRYTGSYANATTSGAGLSLVVNFTATADNKPQFTVKSINLNIGNFAVQTGKWYNGSVNTFLKVNKGLIQSILESTVTTEVNTLDLLLASWNWQVSVPKTDVKIDLRYYSVPQVLNSNVLYLPFNSTIFSA
mmetsp:Transcript_34019/g.59299  ORF Transcript_34019/g.59299 Transcript_34019/m.59299 type:complete len:241 (-) Transcript_34019:206-928(-)